jgi:di/tricarboxylate transporter
VLFFLGVSALAAAAQGTGLLKRILFAASLQYGATPAKLGRTFFLTGGCLSFFLPAEAVAVALFPVAATAADGLSLRPRQGRTALHLFGCAAWGTAAGAMATPAGAAQAALAMALLAASTGESLTFSSWTAALLPSALFVGVLGLLLLKRFSPPDGGDMAAAAAHLEVEWAKAGPMGRAERGVGMFVIAAFALWLALGQLPWLAAASLGVLTGLAAFRLRSWPQVLADTSWSAIPFLGGALILGEAMADTGAARWLVEILFAVVPPTPPSLILLLCPTIFLLALQTGSAAALAAALPVGLAAAPIVGVHPVTAAFAAASAAGAALAVSPTGVPGMIAGSTGYFRRRALLVPGIVLVAAVSLLSLAAAAFYWPLFAPA